MPVVALITDFGDKDGYVGMLKGAILSRQPQTTIVDISHRIQRGNIIEAAFLLATAYAYFPAGTVHVAVVDPGVGTRRAIVAGRLGTQVFLAPDNGLLALIRTKGHLDPLVRVENRDHFAPVISATFHGRDIFAPVAAALATGTDLDALGPAIAPEQLTDLDYTPPQQTSPRRIRGRVVAIDLFGNVITDIQKSDLALLERRPDQHHYRIEINDQFISGLWRTFADRPVGALLAYIGSRATVEIAVNGGSAAQRLSARFGDAVTIEPDQKSLESGS